MRRRSQAALAFRALSWLNAGRVLVCRFRCPESKVMRHSQHPYRVERPIRLEWARRIWSRTTHLRFCLLHQLCTPNVEIQYRMTSNSPFPVDVWPVFQKLFEESESIAKPSSLPVENPTKSYWGYPGLTRDFPVDKENDPDGSKAANPLSHEGSAGPLSTEADLIIIGSGITAISVAFELSKRIRGGEKRNRKFRVVVIEARGFCKSHKSLTPFLIGTSTDKFHRTRFGSNRSAIPQ